MTKDVQRTEEEAASAFYYSAAGKYGPYADAYPTNEESFGFFDLMSLVRRRWEIIAAVIVAGTFAATVYGYTRPKIYVAEARLLIDSDSQVVDLDTVVDPVGSDAAAIETQINLLTSRGFLWEFGKQYFGEDPASTPGAGARSRGGFAIGTALGQDAVDQAALDQADFWSSEMVDQLSENLDVSQLGRSFILKVAYSSPDPKEAANVANGVAQYYIDDQTLHRRLATGEASEHLRRRLAELEADVRRTEEAVQYYRAENMIDVAAGLNADTMQMPDLVNMVIEARAARKEKQARLTYIQSLKDSGKSLDSITEVISSPYMADLWQQNAELRRRESELRLEFGDNHPQIRNLLAEQEDVAARIDTEIGRIVANTRNELDVLIEREKSLQADMDAVASLANKKAAVHGEASVELRLLEQKAAASQNIYEDFLRRLKETQEQEAVIRANSRIVAKAAVPQEPSNQGLGTFMILGFLGSSVLGCGLAYIRDRTDQRLRTSQDVIRFLDLPCLSLVPFIKESKRDKLKLHEYIKHKPLSIYAEAVRSAHTQLRLNSGEDASKVIQITSTFPQEGKTSLAVSLATSLAIDGFSTLLIDLDLRHPSVGREIDISEANCLLNYIYGKVPLDQLVLKSTSKRGCDVIGVKKRAKAPSRALTSKRMTHLMTMMRARYDRIIIDSTPSLGLSDAKMTLCHTDATLFVVHWDKTSTDDVKNALNELRRCHANLCGVVVTQVELGRYARYGYGGIGGYYSKNGYYEE